MTSYLSKATRLNVTSPLYKSLRSKFAGGDSIRVQKREREIAVPLLYDLSFRRDKIRPRGSRLPSVRIPVKVFQRLVGRAASHTLSLAPFTFHLSCKGFGKGFATRSLPPLENTRVNRTILRQTFTLANKVEKAFWDGGDARAFSISFSIFKERRVRIDYRKICRGGGGEFRDEKYRSPRNDKNGVFFGTIWGTRRKKWPSVRRF